MEFPVSAACQCGQVSYTLKRAPMKVFACHCQECQKLSTSPYSVTAVCNTEDVEFRGEMSQWERLAESGNKNYAKFCPQCGNRIYHYNPDAPETVKLKLKPVGSEVSKEFAPQAHVWVSEKQAWLTLGEGTVCFDKQP